MRIDKLDRFYNYVVEEISGDDPKKIYISDEIEDPVVLSIIEQLGYNSDEFYDLEDVVSDLNNLAPEGYRCDSELLLSYDAGIWDGNGAYVMMYTFGKNSLVHSCFISGFESFIYSAAEFDIDKYDKEELTKNILQLIQWSDSPHIQINSLYINTEYLNATLFLEKVSNNLGKGSTEVLISLRCHSDRLESKKFFSRLTDEESKEVKKIDGKHYDWKSYDKDLLKSAFLKGILSN